MPDLNKLSTCTEIQVFILQGVLFWTCFIYLLYFHIISEWNILQICRKINATKEKKNSGQTTILIFHFDYQQSEPQYRNSFKGNTNNGSSHKCEEHLEKTRTAWNQISDLDQLVFSVFRTERQRRPIDLSILKINSTIAANNQIIRHETAQY